MSKITFAENAWEEYLYWQGQDKKTLRRINSLLKTILRDPFDGDGKPGARICPIYNEKEYVYGHIMYDK